MRVAIDYHVHYYPGFSWSVMLSSFASQVSDGIDHYVLCLTDREGQETFKDIVEGHFHEMVLIEHGSTWVKVKIGVFDVLIFNGFQTVSSDGLEILALGTQDRVPDGVSINETISGYIDASAVVCLPWSPGKWLSEKGDVVLDAVESYKGIVLGDVPMRPGFYKDKVFKSALKSGRMVIPGSDPLALKDEDQMVGSLNTVYLGEVGEPSEFLRRSVASSTYDMSRKSSLISGISRWFRLKFGVKKLSLKEAE